MSLSDLASIGSVVSGAAVVVSFLFLALQIRQGNRNQRALMQQGRTDRTVEVLLRMAEPAVHEAMMRGRSGDLTLEPAQADIFVRTATASFANWEDSFLQHRAGAIDPLGRAGDEGATRAILSRPAYRAAWRTVRAQFSGPYRDHIDALMRETKAAPPSDMGATWKKYLAEELATV